MQDKFFKRQLGKTGRNACAMALGCYSMSNSYGARSDAESVQVIRQAIDRGIDLIDTADFYGWGHNEELVAKALEGRRDRVLLSTKFGYVRSGEGLGLGLRSDPAYVRAACEASMRRLNTDCIDVYFQHRLDPQVPIEDTVGAMADLVREGKVRYLGLCEVSEHTLRRACAVHAITAVQAEYSLWAREAEERMLDVYDELGVSLMAFSPLARGMLSGKLRSLDQMESDDVRRLYPRFSPENFPKNVMLVDQLADIAKDMHCSLSQLALAWLFNKDPQLFAICGCDTLAYLDENFGALKLRLDTETIEQIGNIFAPGCIAGDRYPAAIMKMLDR
ncbi:aldo/keto reductase [Noviherbaspirillum saxi]|uniref:Aldo/keto reductase n=1 Tax=Noviherbaspirillum saxi TaxID=2320863 RepID=A0A3A3FVP1_9BURK|nr:aldo/keto reductase [Noviherbaspirillum saxi]RJF98638.1 aldo/keto reductase [Noviherbaspirillum saxi]